MLAPTPYFADRGCHVRIYEEARALTILGHDVRIVTYHIGRDMPDIPVIRIPRIPWYSKLEAGPSLHKLYLDVLLLYKALQLIPDFSPDVIHAHLHEGAFIGFLLKKLSGLPLLFDYQGSLTGECIDHGFFSAEAFPAGIFRRIESRINRCADMIITSSSAGASALVVDWGIEPRKVTPLIDGVDTDVFRQGNQTEARALLGLNPDTPLVAYLGLMNRYQGVDLLMESISILKARAANIHFLLMGFPEERYREEAKLRGVSDMICFSGKVEYAEAARMLSAADIAVTPKLSLTEANGKIFNYMACGLPVVAFDTPVNREIMGDSGWYARYGDAEDLANKISELLIDRPLRADLALRVREKAVLEHSWLTRGTRLVEIYTSIIRV
jgi:glycosyltransferase involved in cell wall biosynthesis